MADPYDDPYRSPYAGGGRVGFDEGGSTTGVVVPDSVTTGGYNASLADKYAAEYRADIAARDKERKDAEQAQQMNVDKMSQVLDETAAKIRSARSGGGSNIPLISMGAAMMGSPGGIGQQLGAGFKALAPAIEKQREGDVEMESKIGDLGLQKGKLAMMPLEDRLKYIQALQTGNIAGLRAIEAAQVKGQTKTATGKMALIEQIKSDAAAKGQTLSTEDALKVLQSTSERNPASMQEVDRLNEERKAAGQPPMPYVDAVAEINRRKQEAGATGHAVGAATAASAMNLPTAEQNTAQAMTVINKILNDPNLDKYVGQVNAHIPDIAIPGKHDFNIMHDNLASQLFPMAIQPLLHMGALSNTEGEALIKGFAQLDRSGSPELYRQGLRDLQTKLQTYLEIARQKAAGTTGAAAGKPIPPTPPGSPSPPTQTSQRNPDSSKSNPVPTVEEGMRIHGPNGQVLVAKGGQWIDEATGQPYQAK